MSALKTKTHQAYPRIPAAITEPPAGSEDPGHIPLSHQTRQSSLCCSQESRIQHFQPPLASHPGPGISSKTLLTARSPRLGRGYPGQNGFSLCSLLQKAMHHPTSRPEAWFAGPGLPPCLGFEPSDQAWANSSFTQSPGTAGPQRTELNCCFTRAQPLLVPNPWTSDRRHHSIFVSPGACPYLPLCQPLTPEL